MGIEIERKFLLANDSWKDMATGNSIRQGYLSSNPDRVVLIRTINEKALITVKSSTDGLFRNEWEYPIPLNDAKDMLEKLCERPLIMKTRFRIPYEGMLWEVDEFSGENAGLVIAEIELASIEQPFKKPDWVGEEVTHDLRYYNTSLVKNPYRNWK